MTPRIGNLPKAITLIPLAALSAVWTVSVIRTPTPDVLIGPAAGSASSQAAAPAIPQPSLPDSAIVVSQAQTPASVSGDAKTAHASIGVTAVSVSADTIPPVALAAYQRAATVIDAADRTCRLDWTLLAAIGRVESDHGRHGGSQLSAVGEATPAIIGPALTGRAGTVLVKDTDGGRLDGDTTYDHAVGPMQFLPSTWSTVGVDADGDGRRDPQDVNDAALAAAVYLCSGPEDLSAPAGQQAALLRYNHSTSYVATVMQIAGAYQTGQGLGTGLAMTALALRAVPTLGADPWVAATASPEATGAPDTANGKRHRHRHTGGTSAAAPTQSPTPASTPSGQPSGQPGGQPSGQPSGEPSGQPSGEPTGEPSTGEPSGQPSTSPGDPTATPPVAATKDELTQLCTDRIERRYPDATSDAHDQSIASCVGSLTGSTMDQAAAQVDAVVKDLGGKVSGLGAPVADPTTDPSSSPSGTPSVSASPSSDPSSSSGP
ncbi:hypothetical protein JCM18899A_36940 [Nocardioides sp. AN3]